MLRRAASAGTDFGTPWALNTTGRSTGHSSSSSTNTAPCASSDSTTCRLWTISCRTYTGAPHFASACSTIWMARSTPAQKPRGAARTMVSDSVMASRFSRDWRTASIAPPRWAGYRPPHLAMNTASTEMRRFALGLLPAAILLSGCAADEPPPPCPPVQAPASLDRFTWFEGGGRDLTQVLYSGRIDGVEIGRAHV